jgi:hypothetical protein
MKPNRNITARDYALSIALGLSQRAINGHATGGVLSLAPGFSRVESGRGNEKTVSTVFLNGATISEFQ